MASASYGDIKINIKSSADSKGIKETAKELNKLNAAQTAVSKGADEVGSKMDKVLKTSTSSRTSEMLNELPRSTSSKIVDNTFKKISDRFNDSKKWEAVTEGLDIDPASKAEAGLPMNTMTPDQAKQLAEQTSKLDLLERKATDSREALARLYNEGATGSRLTRAIESAQKAQAAYNAELEKTYSHEGQQVATIITPEQASELANQIGEIQRLSTNLDYAKKKFADFSNQRLLGDDSVETAKRIADWSAKIQKLEGQLASAITANSQFATSTGDVASQADAAAESVNKYAIATKRASDRPAVKIEPGAGLNPTADFEATKQSQLMGALDRMFGDTAFSARDAFGSIASGAASAASAVGRFVSEVGNRSLGKVHKFTKGLNNIISSFKRIAFYRFIRTVLKEITEGFKEGVDNLYQWSKLANGEFAQSMDRIATSTLYMKNSLGAMVAPLINAIAPAIDFLIDKFVALLNVINRLFALFTGAGYWTKAKKYPTEYAKAVAGGAGKAKEALDKLGLAQIDQLTILDKNHGNKASGGGGGDALDYGSMFETEKLGGGIWDKIKEAIEKGDWRGAGRILAEKLNEVVAGLDTRKWGRELGTKINNGLEFAYGFLKYTDFRQIGGKIADFINGGLESINFETAGRLATRKITAFYDTLIGFVTTLDWGLVGKSISDYIVGRFSEWNEWLEGIDWYKLGTDLRRKFDDMIANVNWDAVGQEVLTYAKNAINAAVKLGIGIILPISDIDFEDRNKTASKLLDKIVNLLNPLTLGLIGFVVGGPGGAAIGATIGLGITFALKTDLVDKADKYGERINEVVGKHTRKAQATIDEAGRSISTTTGRHFGDMQSKMNMSLSGSSTIVHNKTGDISKTIASQWSGIVSDTNTKFGNVGTTISRKMGTANANANTSATTIERTVSNAWSNINRDTNSKWSSITDTIGSWIERAKRKLNFSWKLPEVSLPHIPTPHFSMATGIMGVQYPRFDGWWAEGGFPSTGSLFIANEAGPEMVGTMNGRTAVANNDQIVAGISQGVYEAVRDAMGEGNQAVNVYLDGKQISGSVVKNINSETRRTGSSPLLSY